MSCLRSHPVKVGVRVKHAYRSLRFSLYAFSQRRTEATFAASIVLVRARFGGDPSRVNRIVPQDSCDDAELKAFAVHINRAPPQAWPGYGIYLGNGLVITAAHVPANVAQTKPHVIIGGEDLPAALVKQGSDEIDLTLVSVDATKLPVRLQMLADAAL